MLEAMAHALFVYRQPKLAAAAVITLAFVMLRRACPDGLWQVWFGMRPEFRVFRMTSARL